MRIFEAIRNMEWSNWVHNALNVASATVAAMTLFAMSAGCEFTATGELVSCDESWIPPKLAMIGIFVAQALKLFINVMRDGIGGLYKAQPRIGQPPTPPPAGLIGVLLVVTGLLAFVSLATTASAGPNTICQMGGQHIDVTLKLLDVRSAKSDKRIWTTVIGEPKQGSSLFIVWEDGSAFVQNYWNGCRYTSEKVDMGTVLLLFDQDHRLLFPERSPPDPEPTAEEG